MIAKGVGCQGNSKGSQYNCRRMTQGKEKANRDSSFSIQHQLARKIVDCCDVFGINCMTKRKAKLGRLFQ
jgi:hypothetical protein